MDTNNDFDHGLSLPEEECILAQVAAYVIVDNGLIRHWSHEVTVCFESFYRLAPAKSYKKGLPISEQAKPNQS